MATTITVSPSTSTVTLQSTRNYTGSITSGGYTWTLKSGPSSAYKDVTFDLSSIPADKGISNATLTWSVSTWADSGIDSGYASTYTKVFPGAQNSLYGVSGSQGSAIMTTKVTPGSTFTVRFYYKPSAPSVYYDTDNTHYGYNTCSAYAQFTNISLSVTYTDISNNPPSIYVGVGGVAKEVKEWYVGVGGVAKTVVEAYIGDDNGIARKIYPGLNASYLRTGDTLRINEKGSGTADWIVMGQGHYSSNTVALMRKDILTTGKYSSTSTAWNVYYVGQTLDTYLNTTWYGELSSGFKGKLVQTAIKSRPYSSGATTETINRYIWAPAECELRTGVTGGLAEEGTTFDYFATVAPSEGDRIAYYNGTALTYLTRSLVIGTSGYVRVIRESGAVQNQGSTTNYGYRPVICIPKDATILEVSSGIYTLEL